MNLVDFIRLSSTNVVRDGSAEAARDNNHTEG